MTDIRRLFILLLLLIFPFGCAAPPPVSMTYQKALAHNKRGIDAEKRGESARARGEFAEALQLAGSIEHEEGMTILLINLARVCRTQGDLAAADRYLARAEELAPAASPFRSEVAFERARLDLLAGNPAAAGRQLESAAEGGWTAARLNLHGRILMAQGDFPAAAERARSARVRAEQDGNRVENGNAERLLGDALTAGGEWAAAVDAYRRALAIDKELGHSRKIAADLRALGRVTGESGDLIGAIEYLRRAGEVSRQGEDRQGLAAALREMARLQELRGDTEQAGRLRGEADQLASAAVD